MTNPQTARVGNVNLVRGLISPFPNIKLARVICSMNVDVAMCASQCEEPGFGDQDADYSGSTCNHELAPNAWPEAGHYLTFLNMVSASVHGGRAQNGSISQQQGGGNGTLGPELRSPSSVPGLLIG